MKVNRDKTKVIHVHLKSVPRSTHVFHMGEINVDTIDKYPYLGMDINEFLDYTESATTLANASSRALGKLISQYYELQGMPYKTYTKLYSNTVVPIMDYASGVWGNKDYQKCNTVQHRAMRSYLGVGKVSPIPSLYGDMGWEPPLVRHHVEMTRLWLRLIKMPEDRITKHVFNWDQQVANAGHFSWSKEVKAIFSKCDLGNMFDTKSTLGRSAEYVLQTVRKRLYANHVKSWTILCRQCPD